MSTFTKAQLVERLAELDTFETKKAAKDTLEFIIDTIKENVASGSEVNISGLGKFGTKVVTGKIPTTDTPYKSTVPKFKPSSSFKRQVA